MTYKMFLDDERFPAKDDCVIVRSSQEAIALIEKEGMPIHIFFDHDLGGDDTSMVLIHWIIDKVLDEELDVPYKFTYSIHSQNPIGVTNINNLMNAFLWVTCKIKGARTS